MYEPRVFEGSEGKEASLTLMLLPDQISLLPETFHHTWTLITFLLI